MAIWSGHAFTGAVSPVQTVGMDPAHEQRPCNVRFEWGLPCAAAVAVDADVAIVVDVLFLHHDAQRRARRGHRRVAQPVERPDSAYLRPTAQCARALGRSGARALGGSAATAGQIRLSPLSIRVNERPARLVLPSPNGSTIAHELGAQVTVCLGACLRNAAALAARICAQHSPGAATIAVIAAGEQWPDGGLRPAVEDLWGAGAVIAGLADAGRTALPPEAELAEAGYQTVRGRERQALLSWASGRELVDQGYRADVEVAAEAGLSDAIPLLSGGRFVTAAGSLMVGRGRSSRVGGGWC